MEEEFNIVLTKTKIRKAADLDEIRPEIWFDLFSFYGISTSPVI